MLTFFSFQLGANGINLSIQGHTLSLGAKYPSDAGIIQKTFLLSSSKPIFILAGLGTTGTEVAGKVLNDNCVSFGKLFGKSSFCVLFKTDITRGSDYFEIMGIYPKPKLYRAILYPITFVSWYRRNIFPKN